MNPDEAKTDRKKTCTFIRLGLIAPSTTPAKAQRSLALRWSRRSAPYILSLGCFVIVRFFPPLFH